MIKDILSFYQNQFGISSVNNQKWDMMNSSQRLEFEEIPDPNFLAGHIPERTRKNCQRTENCKNGCRLYRGRSEVSRFAGNKYKLEKVVLRNGVTNSHYYLSMGRWIKRPIIIHRFPILKQEGVYRIPELKDLTLIAEES